MHKAGSGYLDLQNCGPDYLERSFALGQVTWFGPDYLAGKGRVMGKGAPPTGSAAPAVVGGRHRLGVNTLDLGDIGEI